MNNKIILLFFILLILCGSAQAIVKIDIPSEIYQKTNSKINYTTIVTNTHNFEIFNITISDSSNIFFPDISYLDINQSIEVNYSVTTEENNYTQNELLKFNYYTTQDADVTNYIVETSENGNNPNNITIQQGDKISFVNKNMSENYTIKEISNLWSFNIPSGQNVTREFTTIENISYINEQTGYVSYIIVNPRNLSRITHNSAYDQSISFKVAISYDETSWKVHFLKTRYELNYSEVKNGAIYIEILNTEQKAHNVQITSEPDWIIFEKNNFDVEDNTVVTYQIKPKIKNSNETGLEYNITITVDSSNSPKINQTISVYVNKEENIDQTLADLPANFIFLTEAQLKSFCNKFPEQCPHTVIEKIQYINITTNETLEIRELKSQINRVQNKVNTIQSSVLENKESINLNSDKITSNYNKLEEIMSELKKMNENKNFSTFMFYFFIVLVCLILIVLVVLAYFKRHLFIRGTI